MKSIALLGIICFLSSQIVYGRHAEIYTLPEFKFEYNSQYFKISTNKRKNDLTGIAPENDFYVRSKSGKGPSMHIETGYASNHTSNFIANENSYLFANRNYEESWSDYEISKEQITLNGLNFLLKKFLKEECGQEGKLNFYYYELTLDTVFKNFSYLTARITSTDCIESKLPETREYISNLLFFFKGFTICPSSQVFAAYDDFDAHQVAQNYLEHEGKHRREFQRKIRTIYKLDTSGVSLSENSGELISPEQIKKWRKNNQLQTIIDTLTAIRKFYADKELREYLQTQHKYQYSKYRYSQFQRKLSNLEFSYEEYLNSTTQNSDSIEYSLDTLFQMEMLRTINPNAVFNHWDYYGYNNYKGSPWSYYYPWVPKNQFYIPVYSKPFRYYVNYLIRTLYVKHLSTPNNNFYPYSQLIESPEFHAFLVFNPEPLHQQELFLASFKKAGPTWNVNIDTLDKNLRLSGDERLRKWGPYFVFEQKNKTYLLLTHSTPLKTDDITYTGDSLEKFVYTAHHVNFTTYQSPVVPYDYTLQRELMDSSAMISMWHQLKADDRCVMKRKFNPCYSCIDLNHGDTLIQKYDYYQYARMALRGEEKCYRSGYQIEDLNGDGVEELFCYSISNGNLIEWICFSLTNEGYSQIEKTQAKEWIEQNGNCINLKAYSKIGKHTSKTSG